MASRDRRRVLVASVLTVVGLAWAWSSGPHRSAAVAASRPATTRVAAHHVATTGLLAPGSDPSVLPGPLLIADKANNRLIVIAPDGRLLWQFPRPGDLPPGETFLIPDDAFFTPDGHGIVATEEDDFVISRVDVAAHRLVWRYGRPGVAGAAPGLLYNPDDAMQLASGSVLSADIKNCRILLLPAQGLVPLHQLGTDGVCRHDPPTDFGSPNGAFPMRDGNFLVTEINGDWVDEMSLTGAVVFSTHPPGVAYPSDSNEVAPGRYLTVDYSSPGQIVEFDRTGKLLWRYAPTGPAALDHPSLALPLPNGDVLCNDDFNDRVIVVDPRTDRIVWQYGRRGVPGVTPGLLHIPDGVDLAPPNSLLMRFPTG